MYHEEVKGNLSDVDSLDEKEEELLSEMSLENWLRGILRSIDKLSEQIDTGFNITTHLSVDQKLALHSKLRMLREKIEEFK